MMSKGAKPWLMGVHVFNGEDQAAATRALSEIDYRGATWYATKEEAEAEANRMLDAAAAVDPELRWFAVWHMVDPKRFPFYEEAGKCYSATREPTED